MINVAIVEDREEVRQGLAYLIEASAGYTCVATFGDAETALIALPDLAVQVVLMDIGLPGISGIEAVRRLKAQDPALQCIMLTVYEDNEHVFTSLKAGATGYILKNTPPAQLLDSIQSVAAGGSPMSSQIARRVVETFQQPLPVAQTEANLTPREQEILELLVQGYRYREIADHLFISFETVRTHIRHIYEKMHVRSRTEATLKYLGGSMDPLYPP